MSDHVEDPMKKNPQSEEYTNTQEISKEYDPFYLFQLLNYSSFRVYNRHIASEYGLGYAVILSELLNRRLHFSTSNILKSHEKYGSEWFYHTVEGVQNNTGMSRFEQETVFKLLKNDGIIDMKTFGLPPRRHFRINPEALLKVMNKLSTKFSEFDEILRIKYEENKETEFDILNNCSVENLNIPHLDSYEESLNTRVRGRARAREADAKSFLKKERAANVWTSDEEHADLIKTYGHEAVEWSYKFLSEWKETAKKGLGEGKSDVMYLKDWVVEKWYEQQQKIQRYKNTGRERRISRESGSSSWDKDERYDFRNGGRVVDLDGPIPKGGF